MKKTILLVVALILLVSFVSAEQQSLGIFKKDSCVELVQTCADCSFVNFTSVYYPDQTTKVIENVVATKQGSFFNYTICNTSQIGTYIVNGIGDVGGTNTVFAYDFDINAEGSSMPTYILLLIVIIFIYLLLLMGIWKDEIVSASLAAMGMIVIGIYMHINGFGDLKNWVTDMWALVNIAFGTYVLIKALGEEAIKQLG